jgi:aspartate kinase
MALIVQKYGGSSLATPAHIKRAAARIRALKAEGHEVLVVVSAMGRMTDHLIRLAERTVRRPPQRELDMLMTAGERISMALLAMSLDELGVSAISFTGSQSGIVTNTDHTEARIMDIRATRIREELARGKVVIVAGFQGVSLQKEITTLGRGGSDTTAVAMAAILGAERCEILTDVDGLFSADPRVVKGARLLESCNYDEALELASLGAKMHHRSLELARRYRVQVRITSSANVNSVGTSLQGTKVDAEGDTMESLSIRGVATRDGYCYFETTAALAALLPRLKEKRVVIRFFSSTHDKVSFLCERDRASAVRDVLAEICPDFTEHAPVSIVSVVGDGLLSSCDFIPDFMEAVSGASAPCLLFASNSLSATVAVPAEFKSAVAQRLHEKWVASGALKKEEPLPLEGALEVGGDSLPIR